MNGQYFLLISFLITSCTVNTISQTNLKDTYSIKSLLVASWGENQAEIIPTYVSTGLAYEVSSTTNTTKLAPILFELNDDKIYIIDASFQFLNIFDKSNFVQRIELASIVSNHSVQNFKVLNEKECMLVVSNGQSIYYLIHWNFQTKETHTIPLGSYREVQLAPSSDKNSLYYWAEKEDYSGILWQFSTADLKKAPTKFDQLPIHSSKVFEKEGNIMGTKFFPELNRRGLISVNLKTEAVQEIVCAKELYGPLIYPFGMNQAGDLFTYGLRKEDNYGTIYNISKEGILKEYKSFNSLMSARFPDFANTILTYGQSWKVLPDGTIVLAVMTEKEVHVIALESQ
jgi:hypothetical protein